MLFRKKILSAWYMLILTPNIAAHLSKADFPDKFSYWFVLLIRFTKVVSLIWPTMTRGYTANVCMYVRLFYDLHLFLIYFLFRRNFYQHMRQQPKTWFLGTLHLTPWSPPIFLSHWFRIFLWHAPCHYTCRCLIISLKESLNYLQIRYKGFH